jgi:hypothetical protein
VQVGRVRFARVKRDDHPLARKIDIDALHAVDAQERWAQLAYALVTIFAFGRDLDRFQNRVIGALGIKWVVRLEFAWFRWVHHLLNVRRCLDGCLARDWFQDAPDVFGQDFLAGDVWVDAVGYI